MNTEFHTNIKNLPEGEYVTECMYSDAHAYKVVGKTACTVDVVEVLVSPDPEWTSKKEFHPGGFHGHTSNQSEQTWLFKGFSEVTKRLRRNKKGKLVYKGTKFAENRATEFYDYNF